MLSEAANLPEFPGTHLARGSKAERGKGPYTVNPVAVGSTSCLRAEKLPTIGAWHP